MREIRFRAWHETGKTMLSEDSPGDVFRWLNEGQPIKIMQYTGLHDKNGKEIFEGDILNDENNDEYVAVTLDPSSNDFIYEQFSYKGFLELISRKRLCVVGNIHENKDLLK